MCCYCEPSRDYEDCRYYSVAFDMGANIAHCTLNPPNGMEALSYCPCINNKRKCENYISKKDPNGDFIAGQQRMADSVLEIINKWENHLSYYSDGIYVQGQKTMLSHFRSDVMNLAFKGGLQYKDGSVVILSV